MTVKTNPTPAPLHRRQLYTYMTAGRLVGRYSTISIGQYPTLSEISNAEACLRDEFHFGEPLSIIAVSYLGYKTNKEYEGEQDE